MDRPVTVASIIVYEAAETSSGPRRPVTAIVMVWIEFCNIYAGAGVSGRTWGGAAAPTDLP